ncbi:Galacturonosyltransferase 8 [Camellia lanceoleosa]|uniref:Galacturonosyltransferase 8 n=1 Tax=Camellia lanceoleosa TaxID=1840588 RepID=A0ACC0I7H4_9ERIC|nr:Galacturonosyltransferase 8 [Camellia lanceoleosa]
MIEDGGNEDGGLQLSGGLGFKIASFSTTRRFLVSKMASQFALLLGLLAITCSVAFASDNNPLQDFCVADNSSSEDCVSIIGAYLTASSKAPVAKPAGILVRTRPPITTHVLDVTRVSPASGVDVRLEMWRGNQACPTFELAKAQKLKLENSKLVRVFADLSQNYTTLISKPANQTLFDSDASLIDESLLRQSENEVKEQIMDYSIPLLFPFITTLDIRNPGFVASRTARRRGGDGRTGGFVADSVTLQLRIYIPNSDIPTESTEDRGVGLGIISSAGDSRGG